MDDARRRAALEQLYNPKTPNPFVSLDSGKLIRDIPPRRTLRERVRAVVRRRPRRRGGGGAPTA